jgi:glycosyltransferase involved in cell wall biosynthesis
MEIVGSQTREALPFSLIVATVNRVEPMRRLLDSLSSQSWCDFEVIVVDQNKDQCLDSLLSEWWPFPIRHIRLPAKAGASAARNQGWRKASGHILLFPDDDCWYPIGYLERMHGAFRSTNADLLTGRAANLAGETINGRFERRSGSIRRGNTFTTQIEWNMGIKTSLMHQLGGYDEAISLGGQTPWQGGEGYDLVLRALATGATCFYDHDLIGHHEELPVAKPDAAMISKGRAYARGLGFVLRKHDFGVLALGWWIMRSVANLAWFSLLGRTDRVRYYMAQALGRWEGWTRRA